MASGSLPRSRAAPGVNLDSDRERERERVRNLRSGELVGLVYYFDVLNAALAAGATQEEAGAQARAALDRWVGA